MIEKLYTARRVAFHARNGFTQRQQEMLVRDGCELHTIKGGHQFVVMRYDVGEYTGLPVYEFMKEMSDQKDAFFSVHVLPVELDGWNQVAVIPAGSDYYAFHLTTIRWVRGTYVCIHLGICGKSGVIVLNLHQLERVEQMQKVEGLSFDGTIYRVATRHMHFPGFRELSEDQPDMGAAVLGSLSDRIGSVRAHELLVTR